MIKNIKVSDATKSFSLLLMFLYFVAVMVLSYKIEYFKIANIIFVLFAGFVILYRMTRITFVWSSFYIYATSFLVMATMSYYWAIEKSIVPARTETYFNLTVLSIVVINIIETKEELTFSFKAFSIAGVLMCFYTFIFYGFDEIGAMMLDGARIGQEINEANSYGLICGLSFIISTCYAVFERKKIFYLISVILAVSVIMTGSRTATVGIIFAAMLVIILNVSSKKIISTVSFIMIFVIVFNLISQSEYFQNIFVRFELMGNFFKDSNMLLYDTSTETRIKMMEYGLMWFKEKPIIGYGVDQYNILYEMTFRARRPSHNFHIQMLVEFGIIGFVIWEAMFIFILKKSHRLLKKNTESKIVFITVLYLILMGFGNMYTSEKVFWITLGLCFSYIHVYRHHFRKRKSHLLKRKIRSNIHN